MASDGSQVRRLTGDPSPKVRVAWSAKGDRIAYCARTEGKSDLFILAPDGTGRRMVASAREPVASLCWAADGRSLLLGSQAGSGSHLRMVALDGTIQSLGGNLEGGQFPQWVQNPSPTPAPTKAGPATSGPVPALLGAASFQ